MLLNLSEALLEGTPAVLLKKRLDITIKAFSCLNRVGIRISYFRITIRRVAANSAVWSV